MAIAQPDTRRCSPEEWVELKHFVIHGMVFEIQEWLSQGKPTLRPSGSRSSLLQLALRRRNHSMVRLLWEKGWQDHVEAERAWMWSKDPLFLRYLVEHGAPINGLSASELCGTNDFGLIHAGMSRGIEVVESGGWAKAVVRTGARPLIRFYLHERDRLPGLRRQALMALSEAIAKSKLRAVVLLVWAGVDPFERFPGEDDAGLPESEWRCYPARKLRYCEKRAEIVEGMKLRPTAEQWMDLMADCNPSGSFLDFLLGLRPDTVDLIKANPPKASKPLIEMLNDLCWECSDFGLPQKPWRIEELSAACRRLMEMGFTLSFEDETAAKAFRRRIYPCTTHGPVMRVFEFGWKAGPERTRDGIRQLAAMPRMKELIWQHAPALAKELKLRALRNPPSDTGPRRPGPKPMPFFQRRM